MTLRETLLESVPEDLDAFLDGIALEFNYTTVTNTIGMPATILTLSLHPDDLHKSIIKMEEYGYIQDNRNRIVVNRQGNLVASFTYIPKETRPMHDAELMKNDA